jgi:hypothetical protein
MIDSSDAYLSHARHDWMTKAFYAGQSQQNLKDHQRKWQQE